MLSAAPLTQVLSSCVGRQSPGFNVLTGPTPRFWQIARFMPAAKSSISSPWTLAGYSQDRSCSLRTSSMGFTDQSRY